MARRPYRRPDRDDWQPIRAVREWTVDQVFLRRSGGRIVANVSLVSLENELRTEKVFPPTSDPVQAVRLTARFVANLGNVSRANRVRVRWAQASAASDYDALEEDRGLEREFESAFWDGLQETRDRMR